MSDRHVSRRVLLAAAACVLTTTGVGCAGADAGDEQDRSAALAHQAQQVGVALDIFDARRLAQDLYDAMKETDSGDEPSPAVWGNGRTSGSNPMLRALLEEWLPAGWATSRVDQRGWSGVQYCLTAPNDEWYYVRQSRVDEYDDSGRCRLDPEMPSLG